ncbi:hypothetical protein FLK61_40725 [Paenalkalicoccus suaedae]|uniref:Uncharacterized protein n=1 Tax=Paenalkalicoccus suaedae TaxID=2592382 RepID=A0A859FJF0_9BACI|nr:hypothetical protein [Paenalkalicoccus suaedae]QKS72927.1 hypothetical protein FLK61_40725 [Paenalkalicoccus suaedae]
MTSIGLVLYMMPLVSFVVGVGSGYAIRDQRLTLLMIPLALVSLHSVMIFGAFGLAYNHWLFAAAMLAGIITVGGTMLGETINQRYPAAVLFNKINRIMRG